MVVQLKLLNDKNKSSYKKLNPLYKKEREREREALCYIDEVRSCGDYQITKI